MARNVVIGHGYLATALKKRLGDYGWYPTKDTEVVYYLNGVTHMDFEKNPEYHSAQMLSEFATILYYCGKNNIKLIYPSSALIYEQNIDFTRCKLAMEHSALNYKNTIGLRIFPVYGYENRTFIGQSIEKMLNNESPIVYGDGNQARDFIFLDDVIDTMIDLSDKEGGIYDVGTGVLTSFNQIIQIINEVLEKDIKPIYAEAPPNYSITGPVCHNKLLKVTPIKESIEKLCKKV